MVQTRFKHEFGVEEKSCKSTIPKKTCVLVIDQIIYGDTQQIDIVTFFTTLFSFYITMGEWNDGTSTICLGLALSVEPFLL